MSADLRLAEPGDPEIRARVARFGVFELDLRTSELRRDGVLIKLQEQPFRLLVYLLEHAGELVTRDELQRALWPAEFVDFDHSLNTAVRKLRAALDDSAENPRFVETLARRGYRFIAPVSWSGAAAIDPVVLRRRPNLTLIGGVVLALLVIGALLLIPHRTTTISDIAVLPFVNDDPTSAHVSDGLTEILIDRLSLVSNLRVMARATVFDYKQTKMTPAAAGKQLGVAAVVTGQFHRENDGYRIHVELIDVHDGAQLWGESYTVSPAELPRIQDRIAGDLSRRLRGSKQQFASWPYSRDTAAHEEYLLGLAAWNERGASLPVAVQHFQRAIELDPQFAAAYAGLASAYGVMSGGGLLDPRNASVDVLTNARKALALDPNNAEAYTSIATTSYRVMFDFAGAEHDYRRALELNPNYATAHQWYADYLRETGRIEESRREIDLARTLDPLSKPIAASACWALMEEARDAEAVALARRSEAIGRPMPLCVMRAAFDLGDDDTLVDELRRNSSEPAYAALLAAWQRGQRREFLQTRLAIFLKTPEHEYAYPVDIAETYAWLGQYDQAFAWLEKARERRATKITSFHLWPGFDAIRDDPRFVALAHRVGIPDAGLAAAREFAAKRSHPHP